METNEAPEKIYMTPSFGDPDNVLLASFSKSHLDYHRDIEYTRTDAFIDKACEWLENHNDYQRVHDNGRGVRFDMTQCIIDFRKAMEEEV